MRDFLGYAGYFRASCYGKYLLTQVNTFGSKADAKVFFDLYDFDVQLRLLLFKYSNQKAMLEDYAEKNGFTTYRGQTQLR